MSSKLPINLADLLRQRTVEGDRIEYKAGWNPDAILRTLCAFANDFENLGGGYIIIGQDCDPSGQPVFPPVGPTISALRLRVLACQISLTPRRRVAKLKTGLMQNALTGKIRVKVDAAEEVLS